MSTDAKYAHTITSSIAQVGAAIQRARSVSAKDVKDGCAAALRIVKDSVDRLSNKYKPRATLLLKPLETACQLFVQSSTASDYEAKADFIRGAKRAVAIALEGAQALEQEIAPIKPAALHGDGHMEGLDWLGEDQGDGGGGGDIYSSIIKAVGGIAQGGINFAKNKQATEAAAADVNAKVQAAIKADQAATAANMKALVSEMVAKTNPQAPNDAQADRAAANAASAAQDAAGAAVPEAGRAARIAAAQSAVDAAVAKIGSTTGSLKQVAQFTLQAAQATLAKAQGSSTALVKNDAPAPSGDSGGALNFITAKLGPLPRYAYPLIAGGAYLGYRLLKKAGK